MNDKTIVQDRSGITTQFLIISEVKANKLLKIQDHTTHGLSQTFQGTNSTWYDKRGRLLRAQGPYGTIPYQYSNASNLTNKDDIIYEYKTDKKFQFAVEKC